MRILHVVPTYYPAVRYCGTIRAVHELARAQVGRGHDVHAFTTNVDGPGSSDVPLGVPVNMDGVKVWYFSTGAGRRIYRSPAMGHALDDALPRFDIAHLHSVYLWPSTKAARASMASRAWRPEQVIAESTREKSHEHELNELSQKRVDTAGHVWRRPAEQNTARGEEQSRAEHAKM